jgi:hypothetical protein
METLLGGRPVDALRAQDVHDLRSTEAHRSGDVLDFRPGVTEGDDPAVALHLRYA